MANRNNDTKTVFSQGRGAAFEFMFESIGIHVNAERYCLIQFHLCLWVNVSDSFRYKDPFDVLAMGIFENRH